MVKHITKIRPYRVFKKTACTSCESRRKKFISDMQQKIK